MVTVPANAVAPLKERPIVVAAEESNPPDTVPTIVYATRANSIDRHSLHIFLRPNVSRDYSRSSAAHSAEIDRDLHITRVSYASASRKRQRDP